MKTSFLILFFFCICLLVGHGLADAMSIAPRRKTLDTKQPNSNVSPNSCCGNRQSCYCPSCCYSGYNGGNNHAYSNECSQLSDSCFNSDNAMFNWHQTGKGPIQFTFKFSDDCCKAASRIGNDCARNELYQIITRACTGNNSDHNSDDPIGTGSGKCSPIVERCRSLGYAYHYSPGPDGKPKYQIQFSPECCNTVSQITDDCSSDKSVLTIIESCNPKGGNHSSGNDHSGGNDHDGGNNHNGSNSTKGFLGNNGSPKCSPIVRKCMYDSSYFSYHFKSGPDGVKYYVYDFAPDCCSEALQITGDCANDADVKIITDQCKSESG